MIILIIKNGEKKMVEKYRGITLMATDYTVYMAILTEKIRADYKKKKAIPHNQTEFKKKMKTMYTC